MASFEFDIPDDFLNELILTDEIAEEMINGALSIYQKAIQRSLSRHKRTGALIDSVKVKKAKKTRNGAHIGQVTFDGKDGKGVPNIVKAIAIQYGTSKQSATPFMESAQNDCEQEAIDKMQEIYNERMVGR